jgi:hypothetical protein
MAGHQYERAGKDGGKAAGFWHGGENWEGGSHDATTKDYINKYNRLQ